MNLALPAAFRWLLILQLGILSVIQMGCCRHLDSQMKVSDDAASSWIHEWAGQFDWSETSDWKEVPPSNFRQAEQFLDQKPFAAVTGEQVRALLGDVKQPENSGQSPFVVRAVGRARGGFPLHAFIRKNGDVWIGGEAISRCPVPRERRAVVMWLQQPPHEAFSTFVRAK